MIFVIATPTAALSESAGTLLPHRKLSQRLISRHKPTARPFYQKGLASWYSGKNSRKGLTAQGKAFDSTALTAAHPFLPFGTKLLVRSQKTGKSVIVKVNDRGPFINSRVIDLSRAAAAKLGIIKSGVTPVVITKYVKKSEDYKDRKTDL
ncbi:septal ring lytic transglycosylase RlpA family protein [Aristophania vespae]|nr:septal ring lytic transglycosylase RlpA family protein [Aristophania vespae]